MNMGHNHNIISGSMTSLPLEITDISISRYSIEDN